VQCTGAVDCPDIHSASNGYTWSANSSLTVGPWNLDGTVKTLFLDELNARAFAGRSDWRLPTAGYNGSDSELESLLPQDSALGSWSPYQYWSSVVYSYPTDRPPLIGCVGAIPGPVLVYPIYVDMARAVRNVQ
jgi:hypothetical protein